MYRTLVDQTPLIKVSTSKHEAAYALDGSLMNPLEAFYATLAGCAAVFAKKTCHKLGIPAAGIEITCKPFAGPGGPLTLARFQTEVRFPGDFPAEAKAAVLESISACAVKEVVKDGGAIDFQVVEV
ncbi:MAG: OsmC family protein [Betaproteobacteria bacterium]|nr:OsmC family protein [Betaproteobacteria bacterium]